jgi:hypothetical protein
LSDLRFIVAFLLCLRRCPRLTSFRRGTAGAVIGENPARKEKFRGLFNLIREEGAYSAHRRRRSEWRRWRVGDERGFAALVDFLIKLPV